MRMRLHNGHAVDVTLPAAKVEAFAQWTHRPTSIWIEMARHCLGISHVPTSPPCCNAVL